MVPRIEVTRPSNSEASEDAPSAEPGGAVIDANDDYSWADWGRGMRRKSQETIDELESSVSGLSSEEGGMERTSWEERMKWWKVYALHFLFMWNSRTFEYVSVGWPSTPWTTGTDLEDLSCCWSFSREPYSYVDKVSTDTNREVTC
jgi:hypothetical protein